MFSKTLILLGFILLTSCGLSDYNNTSNKESNYFSISFTHNIFDLDDNLKVRVESKNESVPIKVKKGEHAFEIKTKKKLTFLSKKVFNLFTIKDSVEFKNFAKLNIIEEVLQKQNLIGLKSKFLSVNVNGQVQEMFFQEGFDKRILESNSNRDGLIFTFSKESKIRYTPSDKENIELNKSINDKINQWTKGELNTECIVDVVKWGKFLAINEVLNTASIPNQSYAYYLNPVSNLIEPFLFLNNEMVEDEFSTRLALDSSVIAFKALSNKELSEIKKSTSGHKLANYAPSVGTYNTDFKSIELHSCYSKVEFEKLFKEVNGVYTLKQQKNIIKSSVIIPAGLNVQFNSGDELNMIEKGFILSLSPVKMIGSKASPINISSSDSSGNGFHVISARTSSELNYVVFNSLSNLDYESWKLPSAVTFYESPVNINNCTFTNNHCEDAVNIFRSTPYLFENSTISNTFSDAFDADFSNGTIRNSKIINSGNDGVDISGSHITIENTQFINIEDKALSAGENSAMIIDSISIDGASLAIVAKDLSSVKISNSSIVNSQVVYCAFQKKKEFGPSSITAEKVEYSNFKEENLIEEKSRLKVDGEKIHNYRDDVKKYLYGNEYGKKTVK
jgi:hypothetical protein